MTKRKPKPPELPVIRIEMTEQACRDAGLKFVRLGVGMMTPTTTIMELAGLAYDCGLAVEFVAAEGRKET